LPFKDQSPFTTGLPIDAVDVGEYSFFAQLKRILTAIKSVYLAGGHFTLLCDGYIYADIFANGDIEGAGRYKARCEKIKNEYGLYNEVTLFDMREVLFDMPEWKITKEAIEKMIRNLYENNKNVSKHIDFLAGRLMYHVQLPDVSYDEARELYSQKPLPDWLSEKLNDAAIQFTTLLLTLQKTEVIARAFPSAIRCTVHPKAAPQLPLHLTNPHNQLLPYNGVATVSRMAQAKQSLFNAMRIRRLCDIFEHENVVAVHNKKSGEFLYYELP